MTDKPTVVIKPFEPDESGNTNAYCSLIPDFDLNVDLSAVDEVEAKLKELYDELDAMKHTLEAQDYSPNDGALTDTTIQGVGAFDKLLTAIKNNLMQLHSTNGLNYTDVVNAIVQLIPAALQTAAQYVGTVSQLKLADLEAKARIEQLKVSSIATKLQSLLIPYQIEGIKIDNATKRVQAGVLEAQRIYQTRQAEIACLYQQLSKEQIIGQRLQNEILKKQVEEQAHKVALSKAQTIAAMAQYQDVVEYDGETIPIKGVIGKAKQLQTMQIDAFDRDSFVKLYQTLLSAFASLKAADKGIMVPPILSPQAISSMGAQMIDDLYGLNWYNYAPDGDIKIYMSDAEANDSSGKVGEQEIKNTNTRIRRFDYYDPAYRKSLLKQMKKLLNAQSEPDKEALRELFREAELDRELERLQQEEG